MKFLPYLQLHLLITNYIKIDAIMTNSSLTVKESVSTPAQNKSTRANYLRNKIKRLPTRKPSVCSFLPELF